MSGPVDGMARLLAAGGAGAYSTTEVLPAGQVPIAVAGWPHGSDQAIVVTTYPGGPEPDSRNGWEYPRMQVKVRAQDPLAALDLDRVAYDVLHTAGGQVLPGDGSWWLQDCYALQSEAQPLGQDSNGRWEFVRNYQLTTQRTQ